MKTPDTASYQQLLDVLEERLWDESQSDDFGYLVELVNELYLRTIESKAAAFNGCISPATEFNARPY